MKNAFSALFSTLVILAFAGCDRDAASCCGSCDCATKSAAPSVASANDKNSAPSKHPLTGVVTDLVPASSTIMVKHQEIPGVMRAMTMMFTVDPSVLTTVKKGDAITALIYRDPTGTWRLDDVKVTAPTK